jgi:hypothetical protein
MAATTVCLIPCCSTKFADGVILDPAHSLSRDDLPHMFEALVRGRQARAKCIETASARTTALHLYRGYFYQPLVKVMENLVARLSSGELRLLIISAGYGLVDARELLHKYNAEMKGAVARSWRDIGLSGIIADILLHDRPERVLGFFAGERSWSASSANYRYFYTQGLQQAVRGGLNPLVAGCFYRSGGMGSRPILTELGKVFSQYVTGALDVGAAEELSQAQWGAGQVTVRFDRVTG